MKIALLEDEPEQAAFVGRILDEIGYEFDAYQSGQAFISGVMHKSYDLLLLDWQVPDLTGLEVLKTLRKQLSWRIPVLFLTQRDGETDIVEALDAGADDYLTKPPRKAELGARLRALLRRHEPEEKQDVLHFGPFTIDTGARSIALNDESLPLTDKDYDLALFLFQNVGRLLTRELLLSRVWGLSPDLNTRTVDTHMSRLRRRLGVKPENGFRIKTVYQRGYRLESVEPGTSSDEDE